MKKKFDAQKNYNETRKVIGYVKRLEATQKDYDRIGFMSGLEVHQQLKTKEKLFCRCPCGIYHDSNNYDAELIRHMRPTLSELGEYDGTALMEFKTRKEIIYRIKNENACTYEIDDTPPFKIDREALQIGLEISLLLKLNIVGEVHIIRKQYLDGSIPTGFQRTGILGVEGEIQLKNKKVRIMQLSLEEDSCREISDIRHTRIYRTDRLGMPLIETVTYPDMVNPDEVKEAAEYIRFSARSTGKVRVGIGTGREDVNVSCRGGTRVEIKGVSHNKWIPELTHNECFRQWALLHIREVLKERVPDPKQWKIKSCELDYETYDFTFSPIKEAYEKNEKIIVINLPEFKGILSHFTQPGKMFADELSDRLKVIACLEKPNMTHSEELTSHLKAKDFDTLSELLQANDNDAQIILWGPAEDISTAIETVEERCRMAFTGVPNETRKSFEDGTTVFERVLPGADRMYPDTDSAPIPLEDKYIEELSKNLPLTVAERINQMTQWGIPRDTFTFILRNNLVTLIEKIAQTLDVPPKYTGTFLGHNLKHIIGQNKSTSGEFSFDHIYDLFSYIREHNLHIHIAKLMLPVIYKYPKMDFASVLTTVKFKKRSKEEIIAPIGFLKEKYREIGKTKKPEAENNWVMGQLCKQAVGNISLNDLFENVKNYS